MPAAPPTKPTQAAVKRVQSPNALQIHFRQVTLKINDLGQIKTEGKFSDKTLPLVQKNKRVFHLM
ncbi:MAG: hypothetical protein MUF24_03735, partial [Chitinophagaceae bacterium]|nr:hypothetical protein [Chitinophagaceae bacterium]